MDMICPRCGMDNRSGARFCNECGMPFAREGGAALTGAFAWQDGAAPLDATTADLPDAQTTLPSVTSLDAPGVPGAPASPAGLHEAIEDTFYIGAIDPVLADRGSAPESSLPTAPLQSAAHTQELPQVGGVADTQSKAYKASDAKKAPKMPRKGRVANKGVLALIIVVAVALIGAGVAFGTYALQLWGGKQVPNVIGLKAEDATDKLEAAGFTVSQVLVKSDDVEGIVLKTSPEPDRRAEAGTEVIIDVSCARTVPDVIGKSQDEALALLAEEGFENVEVAEQKSNEAPGTIIAVSPEVGVRSKAQSKIALTVAIPYVVPATSGLTFDEAKAALEAEGYVVTSAYAYSEEVPEGSVLGTDPPEGTELASGSEVCINVAKSRANEVVGLARAWFEGSANYRMGKISYELQSVDELRYEGDDTCAFTLTMRPYETHSWFGSQPETRYGNAQKVTGTMRFSSSGQLESMDPVLERA